MRIQSIAALLLATIVACSGGNVEQPSEPDVAAKNVEKIQVQHSDQQAKNSTEDVPPGTDACENACRSNWKVSPQICKRLQAVEKDECSALAEEKAEQCINSRCTSTGKIGGTKPMRGAPKGSKPARGNGLRTRSQSLGASECQTACKTETYEKLKECVQGGTDDEVCRKQFSNWRDDCLLGCK
jgi:hypothetical protein